MPNTIRGLDIVSLFSQTIYTIETRGEALAGKIAMLTDVDELGKPTSTISNEQMLAIQFEIGQYNAMVEMLSSISKSLIDMMKTLAQRSS